MSVCYVIGSGPSLVGFDFDTLPEGYRIGANKSGWLADCDTLVSIDRHFPRKCEHEIRTYRGELVFAVTEDDDRIHPDAVYVRRERGNGLSDDPDALRGMDSGFAALNLAYLRGFKEIALLGFDFKWNGDKSHFHDGYPTQNKQTPRYLSRWAKCFDYALPQLESAGVSVTNFVGPNGSKVTAFPTKPLKELT